MDRKTAIEVWTNLTEQGFEGASIHMATIGQKQGEFVVALNKVIDYHILHKDDLRLIVEVADRYDLEVTMRDSTIYLESDPSNGFHGDRSGKTPNTKGWKPT